MTSSNIAPSRPFRRWRWAGPSAAALAAAMLLTGCSGGTAPAATVATTAAAVPATAGPTSSSTSSATAAATPTALTAKDKLVAGFPARLIPVMKGAQVQSSSLQHSTPLSVATLIETVTAKPADVLAFYTKVYEGQKFTALKGEKVDGTPLKTFVRSAGQETVNVAVVETGNTATVTIGANVLPASLK
ncbi:hypothetical protein [Arthrobacter sp. SDTb3-6]|uniref:hypothetical protein n=1 Tax=Arthrobacter sp. SDTb3-6 TaxID=2713571 RepID=UPI00210B2A79|nr:hypothetical protein [Arthrobacter sp. SDTb3-6]